MLNGLPENPVTIATPGIEKHNIFLLLEALKLEMRNGKGLSASSTPVIHKHALELITELLKSIYDSPTASMQIHHVRGTFHYLVFKK